MNKQRHTMPSNDPPAPFIDLTTTLNASAGPGRGLLLPFVQRAKVPRCATALREVDACLCLRILPTRPLTLSLPSHYAHTTCTIHRFVAIDSLSCCIASAYISLARETIDKRANGASLHTSKAFTLCSGAESASNDRTPTYTS